MSKPLTWFERRFREHMKDPGFAGGYRKARAEIDAVDARVRGLVQELDAERTRQGLTKSKLARLSDLPDITVRRLLTAKDPDPKVSTLMPMAMALGRPLGLLQRAHTVKSKKSLSLRKHQSRKAGPTGRSPIRKGRARAAT